MKTTTSQTLKNKTQQINNVNIQNMRKLKRSSKLSHMYICQLGNKTKTQQIKNSTTQRLNTSKTQKSAQTLNNPKSHEHNLATKTNIQTLKHSKTQAFKNPMLQ